MLARLNKSLSIVECGTSFGLSAIYLALAVNHNASSSDSNAFGVLTIEKDPTKVKKAKEIWAKAGLEIETRISSIEGDLLEVLANGENLPDDVDFLFLDGTLFEAPPMAPITLRAIFIYLTDGSVDIFRSPSFEDYVTSASERLSCHRGQDSEWQIVVSALI
jgi:predicted O-methyltransferase YrrM